MWYPTILPTKQLCAHTMVNAGSWAWVGLGPENVNNSAIPKGWEGWTGVAVTYESCGPVGADWERVKLIVCSGGN